jgi:hypothetical protein
MDGQAVRGQGRRALVGPLDRHDRTAVKVFREPEALHVLLGFQAKEVGMSQRETPPVFADQNEGGTAHQLGWYV